MASVCEGSSREAFVEQIFSSLITLTIHLNDPDDSVRESCKACFQSIAPLLDQPPLVELVKELLIPKVTLNYSEFIADFAKILVQQYPYKVNFFIMNCIIFFKNPVSDLRANAAIIAGYLILNLTEEQINNLSKEHILNGKNASIESIVMESFCLFSLPRSAQRSESRCALPCRRIDAFYV